MSIIIFIIILAILIFVHELGHFIVAKKSGVRVDEFALGFPPRLFSWQYGETRYALNLIPFGGYVKIYGETPDEESLSGPDSTRSLVNKPKKIQALVLVAGVSFNMLLAWILLSLGFMIGLPLAVADVPVGGIVENQALTIVSVLAESPAELAGLKPGDEIVQLTNTSDSVIPSTPTMVRDFISESDTPIDFHLLRSGIETVITVEPVSGLLADLPAVGIATEEVGIVSLPFFRSLYYGARYTFDITALMITSLGQIIVDLLSGQSLETLIVGPVGIVGLVGDAASLGFIHLLTFTALISINLAIINLLPFPALDGGRILFLVIEALKGSPIKPNVANTLNLIGFSILILLMLFVTFNDIIRLF